MQQWWWSLAPVGLGAVGFLLKRWIEGRRRSEGLKRKLQALALHAGLRREGLTMDDLATLERKAGE